MFRGLLSTAAAVRDFATRLATRLRVSASTQNQAVSALLFLCREVLGIEVEGWSSRRAPTVAPSLPVVMSMPETAALLDAMPARRG